MKCAMSSEPVTAFFTFHRTAVTGTPFVRKAFLGKNGLTNCEAGEILYGMKQVCPADITIASAGKASRNF
jgi:hypothetical protein